MFSVLNAFSLPFFNIEIFFFSSLLLLTFFVMGKGINQKLRFFFTYYYRDNFIYIVNTQVFHFFSFVFIIVFFIGISLIDKRFFFFDLSFFNDNFVLLGKFLALFSTFLVLFLSNTYLKFEQILKSFEYFLILLLGLLGMFFLVSSNDFLALYLSVEFQSLALYVLAAFKQNSLFSIEAGLKYFILGTFSSGLLLFGASLLYGFTGTLNFSELDLIFQFNNVFKDDYLFKLGLLFFFFFAYV